MKRYLLIMLVLLYIIPAKAQDLNARVQVLAPTLSTSNKRIFEVLETNIRDFLNAKRWSADNLQPQERIDCNFIITINDWDGSNSFRGEAQIQSSRPIYGSTYNSTILNINDKDFDFNYTEGQPLDYSDQAYISNLSSLLAFYAYVITGMDYDSFTKMGGTPFYTKAQAIVNYTQSAPNSGWKAFEGLRNRYWLSENLSNKSYSPIREALYEYHRTGMDLMFDNQSKGRKNVFSTLSLLQKIDKQKQGSMLPQLFFTAKADEIVNILSSAAPQDKMKAYNILSEVDPANTTKYELLKKSQ
ncbi:MAG: DUF4835 family protein [Daejeonella sp.]